MYKYAVLYLVILIGIFFEPDFLGSAGNILLKFLVLAAVSYLLYVLWKESETAPEEEFASQPDEYGASELEQDTQDFPHTFFDNEAIRLSRLLEEQPRYMDYLRNQFLLIRDFVLPHNGYLIHLYGNQQAVLLYEETKTELRAPFDFSSSQIFTLVERNNDFLVENNLEPETKLLPFYEATEYHPGSCLAFSTLLPSQDKLYWIFDADSAGFFNDEDFETLRRVNANTLETISGALLNLSLNRSFSEEQLKFNLADSLNLSASGEECIDAFVRFVVDKFEASKLTVALRTSATEAVIRKAIGIDDPFKDGVTFPLDEGLNGWVIAKNSAYLIDNIDKGEYFIPRFSRSEKINYELRSFLSTPISLDGKALGMVTLEDKKENKYNEEDKKRLMLYSAILARALGRFQNATQGE